MVHFNNAEYTHLKILARLTNVALALCLVVPGSTLALYSRNWVADANLIRLGASGALISLVLVGVLAWLRTTISGWQSQMRTIKEVVGDMFAILDETIDGESVFVFPGINAMTIRTCRFVEDGHSIFKVTIVHRDTIQHDWEVSRTRIAPVENVRHPLPIAYLDYVQSVLQLMEGQVAASAQVKKEAVVVLARSSRDGCAEM